MPVYLSFLVNQISNSQAKERLFEISFKDESLEVFNQRCSHFSKDILNDLINPLSFEKLKWHLQENHDVVIVSASISNYINPLFQHFKIDFLCTELESNDGNLTGRFQTANCYGEEKEKRIHEKYDLTRYNEIYAYGDSDGDREMLALATKSFYRCF